MSTGISYDLLRTSLPSRILANNKMPIKECRPRVNMSARDLWISRIDILLSILGFFIGLGAFLLFVERFESLRPSVLNYFGIVTAMLGVISIAAFYFRNFFFLLIESKSLVLENDVWISDRIYLSSLDPIADSDIEKIKTVRVVSLGNSSGVVLFDVYSTRAGWFSLRRATCTSPAANA